ncbi:MAG: SpoIIE family protein phosphatase [Bacteroidetes bacterium]|nr:SpoIIE family protein phosphatase [Bacteroidota bacterium]
MIINFKYYLFICFIIKSILITAQEYPIKYYSLKDGLPHSMVADIYQDKESNLWFSTYGGGISKFDGETFKNYGLQNGLLNLVTRSVAELNKNEFIIGTIGGGLFLLKNDTVLKIHTKLAAKEIFQVIVDSKKNIWAGTEKGLIKINSDSTIENISKKYKLPEYAVVFVNEDKQGNIWFGYDSEYGLFKLSNNKLLSFNQINGLTNERILTAFHDSNENTWVGASNGLYLISKGNKAAVKINNDQLPKYYLFSFAEPLNDVLIIGSQDASVVVYNTKENKVLKTIRTNNGLKVSTAFRVFADKENNIWISNWGEGVANIYFNGWTKYNEKNGLQDRMIYSINSINNKLVVTSASGVFFEENNYFKKNYINNFKGSAINIFKYNNNVFVATDKELIQIDDKTQKTIKKHNYTGVRNAVIDNENNIYFIGWGCGIVKYDGKEFKNINDSTIASIKYFYSCFKDSKGNLWFASSGAGLVNYSNGKWQRYSTENGMPINIVNCITEDKNGNIIAGTNGGGIISVKSNKIKIINTLNGLPSNIINSILVDKDNYLWVGMPGSIAKLKLASGKMEIISNEIGFDGDCLNSSILEVNNKIFVGTNNYLWKFDEQDVIKRKNNLTVVLDEIKVNDIKLNNEKVFKFYENKFKFNFHSTQLYNRKNIKYVYRLIGLDSVFTKQNSINEVTFHKLQPGDYTFEVKAVLDKTIYSDTTKYSFKISPPFYKTWWFIISSITLLIFATKAIIKYREKKYIVKQKELESLVNLRTIEISNKKAELEEKQKEILDSIHYAKRIQNTLLAHHDFLNENIPNNFVYFNPKDIVSGDFYWATKHGDNFYLAVCDSTGHGVPGAFMSLLNIGFLTEAINEKNFLETNLIFEYVRERLMSSVSKEGQKDGFDGIIVRFNQSTKEITYTAAHNAPILISNNELIELQKDKMPVGIGERKENFTCHKLQVKQGDILYLYTDGYADQFGGPKGKKFKYKPLNELLLSISNKTLSEQKQELETNFKNWKGDLEQVDDVCIVGIRF